MMKLEVEKKLAYDEIIRLMCKIQKIRNLKIAELYYKEAQEILKDVEEVSLHRMQDFINGCNRLFEILSKYDIEF